MGTDGWTNACGLLETVQLDHMVVLFLAFGGTTPLAMPASVYTLATSGKMLPFPHSLASLCCQLFSLLIFGFPVAFYCNKLTEIKTLPSFLKLINSRRILMYTQHNTSQQKQSHAGATAN